MHKDQDQFIGQASTRRITRRGFLIGSAALTGLALFGGFKYLTQQIPHINPDSSSLPEDFKKFEALMEDKPLLFEQAKMLVPAVVKLYIDSTGTLKPSEQIAKETFIIQRDLKQLYLDYPNVKFPKEVEQTIEMSEKTYSGDHPSGFSTKGQIFLFLEEINSETPNFQYDRLSKSVNCAKATPTVKFRSSFLQETVLYDCVQKELDREIIESYQRINSFINKRSKETFTTGDLFGFWTTFYYKDGVRKEAGLAKITADYITTNISLSYGLPYTTGIRPVDFINFDSVILQANITINELLLLHRQSNLKEFMLKIAAGAQNIDLPSDKKKLDFATSLFLFNSFKTRWEIFQPYFPKVDILDYEYRNYNEYSHLPDIKPGCLNR